MRCILCDEIQIVSSQVGGFILKTRSGFEEVPSLNFGIQLIIWLKGAHSKILWFAFREF